MRRFTILAALGLVTLSTRAGAQSQTSNPLEPRRVSLLLEGMPLIYQSLKYEGFLNQTGVGWGSTALTVGGDVRIVAGLEAGLSVSYLLSRSESEQRIPSDGGTVGPIRMTVTQSTFATTPRVSYRIPLAEGVAAVPRVGARFSHSNLRQSVSAANGGVAPNIDGTSTATWGVLGALLELDVAGPVFAAVGPEFSVRLGGSTEPSGPAALGAPGLPEPHAWQIGLVLGIGTNF
jgi:hypothetical protein